MTWDLLHPCYAYPDVWLRSQTKYDGEEYYEYVLIYVDDILCFSHDPHFIMNSLASLYKLKGDSVKEPDRYLGANIEKYHLFDRRIVWSMSEREYLKNSVKIVEKELVKRTGRGFSKRIEGPMDANYRPEIDRTQFLDTYDITIYQFYIGILQWAVELGRLDILHKVSKLSFYNASPRIVHLDTVFRIFGYLKMH